MRALGLVAVGLRPELATIHRQQMAARTVQVTRVKNATRKAVQVRRALANVRQVHVFVLSACV